MKNPLTHVLADLASEVTEDMGDTVDKAIKLGCLAVAGQLYSPVNTQHVTVVDMAQEFYDWVNG